MSYLALDLGKVRTGLAVSNWDNSEAIELVVLASNEVLGGSKAFRDILSEHEVEAFVVGLPLTLEGKENAQTQEVRRMAAAIEQLYGLPIYYQDERLSSIEAKGLMRQMGYSERQMRGNLDRIAAYLILRTWLKCQKNDKGLD